MISYIFLDQIIVHKTLPEAMELCIGQHPVVRGSNSLSFVISNLRREEHEEMNLQISQKGHSYIQDILATLGQGVDIELDFF